jgi:SRSO17 transposase
VNTYNYHFQSYRHDVSDKARQYACGLMQAGPRKNMDRMAEVVPDSKSRNLQQFLTHSKWSHREVIDHVANDVDELLGGSENSCLLLDESAYAKQGKSSVGVSRQWLGRFGKVDNGQVAVYGALAKDQYIAPIDVRFYLPKEWANDPQRCHKAGIPKNERIFKTKTELALEIVKHARENDIRFSWVGADSGYGKGPGLCISLDEIGEIFMIDVHSDFHIYIEDPDPYLPEKKTKRGRKVKKYKTDKKSFEVREVVKTIPIQRWKKISIRDTTRGKLNVRICRITVYIWDGKTDRAKRWTLVVTKSIGPNPDTKISLTNAPHTTSLHRLGWMQRQRFWIERTFEDAKSECGMADYQVRKWSGWHHHMALVMMSILFMLTERIHHKDTYPLLSCADIERLLTCFLPRRDVTEEEVIRQLEYSHIQRQNAIDSHFRKQKNL